MKPNSPLGPITVHQLDSAAVGDAFTVFVAECGQNSQSTLLVTDANGLFGLAVDTVRLMQIPALVPSMLVVGIGYPNVSHLAETAQIRARDLTPTSTPVFDRSGGADALVRFIESELWPVIEQQHPRAAGDSTFFGHSLGGLFGSHVLLERPDLFTRFIISSPSLWWDDELLLRRERARAETHDDLDSSVYFGIGSLETDSGRRQEGQALPEDHPAKPPSAHLDMVDDLRRFVDQLRGRSYPNLDIECAELADEFHATVPAVTLSRGLRHFFASVA